MVTDWLIQFPPPKISESKARVSGSGGAQQRQRQSGLCHEDRSEVSRQKSGARCCRAQLAAFSDAPPRAAPHTGQARARGSVWAALLGAASAGAVDRACVCIAAVYQTGA